MKFIRNKLLTIFYQTNYLVKVQIYFVHFMTYYACSRKIIASVNIGT